ncbi:hypothetical protein GCM10027160_06910 [Streptomyces calidiresistens]|uniref:Histidine phosphatase family protein n=1 Tax=Streptomyces calidiresistens TaxID=1485586 RepID=A0A7W3T069_9ACTN|nr:histidine phosphatase family protein [Streptomyces calidiresistens]MBB0228569.1 histidine phosphatase family protein [Streptomyces calidiresistens]
MADIHIMRHAAYEGHRLGHHAPPDAPLSAEGCDQLRRMPPPPDSVTAIVTSPLLRARQTAETLGSLTGLPVIATSDLLVEWRAPTSIQGTTSETCPPAYRAWRILRHTNPHLAYEDGESLVALHRRATHAAAHLHHLAGHRGGVLVVSHKLLLGVLLRLPMGPSASFEAAARAVWPFGAMEPFPRHRFGART